MAEGVSVFWVYCSLAHTHCVRLLWPFLELPSWGKKKITSCRTGPGKGPSSGTRHQWGQWQPQADAGRRVSGSWQQVPALGLDVGTCLAFSQGPGFMGSRASRGFPEGTNSHCYLLLQSPLATSQVLRGPHSPAPPLGPFVPSEPSLLCEAAGKACSHYLGEKLHLEGGVAT